MLLEGRRIEKKGRLRLEKTNAPIFHNLLGTHERCTRDPESTGG